MLLFTNNATNITAITIIGVSITTMTSLALKYIFLSNGPYIGLDVEYATLLNLFLNDIINIIQKVLVIISQPCSAEMLQQVGDILRNIIIILKEILAQLEGVIEDLDSMNPQYDSLNEIIHRFNNIVARSLFSYRQLEKRLGILPEDTRLVPDEKEVDFFETYVLAVTLQPIGTFPTNYIIEP